MTTSILAVVVTYNRCELLARCLDYLQQQSRQPEQIVVINNGSTDATESMLYARNVRCITQENVGSAGGWHRGIQIALDEGFDAVWLMDDDGYPAHSALNYLEHAFQPWMACVSSVVLCEDDASRFVFAFPVLDQEGLPVIFGRRRKIPTLKALLKISGDGMYPFAHFFNGALVSVAAVRQVGSVNRDFFIFGEEVDFFFRLREFGPVYSVLAAHHLHPDVGKRPYTPGKIYYYVKNTLVLNARYFNAVWLRHCLTILAVLARTTSRNGKRVALSYVFGGNAPTLWRAIMRGLQGRVGRDFND